MATLPQYPPTAVVDIVGYGYKRFFQSLWPLTKLFLPPLLIGGLISAPFAKEIISLQMSEKAADIDTTAALIAIPVYLFSMLLLFYGLFAIAWYARDQYCEAPLQTLAHYYKPRRQLWGLMGLFTLQGFVSLLIIALFIGIIFLLSMLSPFLGIFMGLLGTLILIPTFVFVGVRLSLSWTAYLVEPGLGVFQAFVLSWRLTQGHFWRTLFMSFFGTIIQTVIGTPFQLFQVAVQMFAMFNPSILDSFLVPLFFAGFLILSNWAQFVIGTAGIFYVYFRFYFDLKGRHETRLEAQPQV